MLESKRGMESTGWTAILLSWSCPHSITRKAFNKDALAMDLAMKPQSRYFILTEAARLVPLVRGILVEIREARSRLSRLGRLLDRVDWTPDEELSLRQQREAALEQLQNCLGEASRLGVEITSGVRCEALFPFEHRWVGQFGDQQVRQAYFIYDDSKSALSQWFFSGWPRDRRPISKHWWTVTRPAFGSKTRR